MQDHHVEVCDEEKTSASKSVMDRNGADVEEGT